MKMGNATVNLVKSGQLLLKPTIIGCYLLYFSAELGNWICFFCWGTCSGWSCFFLVGKLSLIGRDPWDPIRLFHS